MPLLSSCERIDVNCLGSSYKTFAILLRASISQFSDPKDIKSTIYNSFKIFIAPNAKFSELEVAYKVGSSMTRSIPFSKAI